MAARTADAPVEAAADAPASEPPADEFLVAVDGDLAAVEQAVTAAGGEVEAVFGELDVIAVRLPAQAAAQLAERADLAVEPNPLVHAFAAPPSYGLDRIDQRALPLSGSYTRPSASSGAGVDVYVMDSGVRADHVQFGGRVATGFTAVFDGWGSGDCNGHGTHVAGTIAGATVGVAPAATIVPVRVLDCNGDTTTGFEFLDGIDWLIEHHQAGKPAVLNLSLGGAASQIADDAIAAAVADGIVVVVAAGNENQDACAVSPARAPVALTVAASTISDGRASYSNYGSCVDLFAPGGDAAGYIVSAWNTGTTALVGASGTSMAAPHVAGVAARLLSTRPSITPAAVSSAILCASTYGAVTGVGAGTPNRLLYADVAEVPSGFVDVAPSFLYYTHIQWMAAQRISEGFDEGNCVRSYRPGLPVNRDAMAAFMYRLAGSPASTPPTVSPFIDVRTDHPFYTAITWLEEQEITLGYLEPDGRRTWRGLDPVSRDAMALFMYRYSGEPALGLPAASPFTDLPRSHPSYAALVWMNANGITTGFDDGAGRRSYRGLEGVYRDSMAAFMYRLVHNPSPPANPGDTVDCVDFSTWHQANTWYARYYPYYGDIAILDGDADGIVCESLPGR